VRKIKKILVLGLGKSGKAATDLALHNGISVTAIDDKETPELSEFSERRNNRGFEACFSDIPSNFSADLAVISPGIPKNSKLAKFARQLNLNIVSEIEFASRFSRKTMLAIGGTNGKTTTTELCSHILNEIGVRSSASGNTGFPLSEAVMQEDSFDAHVVETSSFQLENSPGFKPEAAALLNISSDHMDRYGSFEEYKEVKFRIFKNLRPGKSIVNATLLQEYMKYCDSSENPFAFSVAESNSSDIFSNKDREIFLKEEGEIIPFMRISQNLPGRHNVENALAAIALVKMFVGKDFYSRKDEIKNAVDSFKIGRHRLEVFLIRDGIKYVNDSKATNPDSTLSALEMFGGEKNVLLILGGLDKEMDFSPLARMGHHIKKAYITGLCKEKLNNVLKKHINCALVSSFYEAVMSACEDAVSGDVVLLSPACASMDVFKNYQERGNKFIEIIKGRFSK